MTGVRTPRNVLHMETTSTATEIHCPTCDHSVSAAHVPGSYTCNRAAGVAPEESGR